MHNILHTFFPKLFLLLLLGIFAETATAQLLQRHTSAIDLVAEITPQVKDERKPVQFDVTREMDTALKYAQTSVDPLKRNMSIDQFLNRYYPYFETQLMRNGDIAYLKFYYEKYLRTLGECLDITSEQPLEFVTNKRAFFKQSTFETRKEKRLYWRKFDTKRNELVANFFRFREYIIPAVSTEISLILQEEHFPELAQSMNNLENLDGTPLEVAIYSNRLLVIPTRKNATIAGLSIISKCEDVFTSGSPAVRDAFPGLRGSNKGLTVHLRLFENGVTLSHELGHLYYLYHKWEEYVVYIQRKGKDYETGGHGPDDPSGLAARMTEEGKMPF
ncbi:MAG: hypothetical protein AB8G86_11135 [Saprospiraceae bacterium]